MLAFVNVLAAALFVRPSEQHSSAQHSTAQHSTAQHSAASRRVLVLYESATGHFGYRNRQQEMKQKCRTTSKISELSCVARVVWSM
jgi:hypothetical protein